MNLSVIEEWISTMELPRGIGAHFASVRDLLNWLQVQTISIEVPGSNSRGPAVLIFYHRVSQPDCHNSNDA